MEQFIERERTFTRNAGHELRTPMAVIKGSLELLTNRPLEDKDREIIERMQRVTQEMQTMFETLLMLAREEDVFAENTSINEVLAEEIEMLTEVAEARNNRVTLVEATDAVCNAKPSVLSIIASNLIRNALIYTENGDVEITVNEHHFAVKDNGVGMSDTDMDNAFTAFFRGETAKTVNSGQGLGLALVRRLAQQLEWRVQVESKLGEGTLFKVWYR